MANRVRGLLERLLGRAREALAGNGVADAELLRRFAATADEAACGLLVWRHGAMVLGVCRRGVRDEQLAEDAFQAVFLVLARKAASVRGGNLAGWLFRVARRTAARVARTPPVAELRDQPAEPVRCPAEARELAALLDAEVSRLPDRLRRPVVLCYLGGRTTEEAARELGCARGTVLSRLAAARKLLADRLTRRGITLPAALSASTLGVSSQSVRAVTAAALPFRLGTPAPTNAAVLATGVCHAMTRVTITAALGGVVLAAGLATGIGLVAAQAPPPAGSAGAGNEPAAAGAPEESRKPAAEPPPKPTTARQQFDERLRKLERLEHELAAEVEAMESNVRKIARSTSSSPARVISLQKRADEFDSELTQLQRDLVRAESERKILRDRVASPPRPDPLVIESAVNNHGSVRNLMDAINGTEREIAKLKEVAADGEKAKRLRDELADMRGRLTSLRKSVAAEAEQAETTRTLIALKARVTELDTKIDVLKDVREKFLKERDQLQATLADAEQAKYELDKATAALAPQRDMLAKLKAQVLQLRIERELAPEK